MDVGFIFTQRAGMHCGGDISCVLMGGGRPGGDGGRLATSSDEGGGQRDVNGGIRVAGGCGSSRMLENELSRSTSTRPPPISRSAEQLKWV